MSDTEREISAEGEIELFDSIIAGGSLYLTGIGIDEERDWSLTSDIRQLTSFVNKYKISSSLLWYYS